VETLSVAVPVPPGDNMTVEFNDIEREPKLSALSSTVPWKPSRLERRMVDVAFLPCSIVKKLGLAETVKSGPVTITGTITE